MLLDVTNFLHHIKHIVMGGGATSSDRGFIRDVVLPLSAVDHDPAYSVTVGDPGATPAVATGVYMADDETNGRVLKVEETVDDIFRLTVPIPRDYDEVADVLRIRVLASQLSVSTDDDVELDSELYRKRPAVALSADLAPAAPGTVLSTTEQWIEFDYTGLGGFQRDDVFVFHLRTNGGNDTNAEEVLIHGVQLSYASSLVSYNDVDDASGNPLR